MQSVMALLGQQQTKKTSSCCIKVVFAWWQIVTTPVGVFCTHLEVPSGHMAKICVLTFLYLWETTVHKLAQALAR
jgi:hypothetical protein